MLSPVVRFLESGLLSDYGSWGPQKVLLQLSRPSANLGKVPSPLEEAGRPKFMADFLWT